MAHRTTRQNGIEAANSLVASAMRYGGKVAAKAYTNANWQRECYRHYRICGEARYAARFYGHALSRAVLGVGTKDNTGIKWSTSGQAKNLLDELFKGKDGQTQMLESIGLHFAIAGECYLVGRTVSPTAYEREKEVWEILSVEEISVSGRKWVIKYDEGSPPIELADTDVVIRLWMSDPARRVEADSPFRSLLPILTEIEWLTKSIFGQVTSRLAGAGLLLMPQGITFPPPPDINGVPQEYKNEAEGVMIALADNMMAPLEDPSNPASKVPVIGLLPADAIDSVKLIQFWSELDAASLDMRSEAIRRFALGMDVPPEQILGMASNLGTGGGSSNGVSHWGAWQIEEQTIKMHIEPMLDTVTNALTVGYLRPLLDTDEEIFYDTAALRLRPDRSKESMELYDRGVLKAEVMLRENGFDQTVDAPDETEYKAWLLRKIASGSATPEQVGAALELLGVSLPVAETPNLPETRETPQPPSLEDHNDRPRTPAESSALVAACDGLVWRALEKAGNRVLNAGVRGKDRDRTIEPTEFYLHPQVDALDATGLVQGAFTYAPQVLAGIADADRVITVLENYCAALIAAKAPHSKENLASYLKQWGVAEAPNPPIALTVNVENNHTPSPVNVNMPEIKPTFNIEPTQVDVHVPEHQTNVTVEAAQVNLPEIRPEVKVEVNPTPITVQAAKAPAIHVNPTPVTVEAAAAPTVNVNVEPTPVTVENNINPELKMPEQKPRETRVLRDADDNIIGTKEV